MEKLNLNLRNEEDFYKLELPDGSIIEFDLTDIGLAERIMNSSDELEKMAMEEDKEIAEITENEKDPIKQARRLIELSSRADRKKRELFDSFLGVGTCDKLFGARKNEEQYFRLLEALEPHFKKMNVQIRKAKIKLADRYLPKDEDVM